MKHFATLAGLALLSTCALAAPKVAVPAKKAPMKAPVKAPVKTALKTLDYCPISGEKLPSKTLGATTYKGYKIAFCCAGCPQEFASLSEKDKDAKIAAIVAKQTGEQAKPKA